MTDNVIKLGSAATIDISNVDKKAKENETPVRLCNFVDVYHNWAITRNIAESFMNATANKNQIARFSVKQGCVAVTKDSETRDDIGIPTYFADYFDDVVLGYHCALITPNESLLDGRFLNVVLHTNYAKKYFAANASGSGQRYTLTSEIIEGFPVPLLPMCKQKAIGKLFSDIDRKIELNHSIYIELERTIKDIYDFWFVQFDFPDEHGKPYKASGGKMVWDEELKREIPAGWCVDALRSHITSSRGISYDTKALETAGIPMINLASFSVDSTYKPAGIKNFGGDYSNEKVLHPYDLVMCNTQQTAPDPHKDIIGKSLLVPDIFDGDVVSSHHVTSIKTDNDDLKYYFNATFKTSWFHKYIIGFASGTNILGLDFKGVENYLLPIPPASVLQKFAALSHHVEAQKSVIIKENEELTSLRDFLLPMLMNGQVSVKESPNISKTNG